MYVEIKAQRSVQNLDFTPVSCLRCILFAALPGGPATIMIFLRNSKQIIAYNLGTGASLSRSVSRHTY
jgi:hypothetical protein